jgi:hypothetical protein
MGVICRLSWSDIARSLSRISARLIETRTQRVEILVQRSTSWLTRVRTRRTERRCSAAPCGQLARLHFV